MMSETNRIIGCIGCGSMGGALLRGFARQRNHTLLGCDQSPAPLDALEAVGVVRQPVHDLAKNAGIVILAVKPAHVLGVVEDILPFLTPEKILISVAAIVGMSALKEMVNGACPVVRVMPNTSAMAGAGTFGICLDDPLLTEEQKKTVSELFTELGQTVVIPEARINAFMAAFACGPGYVFHFMEALAEAAVTMGFSRSEANELSAAVIYGAGKQALESGQHPAILREQVCSPGGVTIAAVNHLDRMAMRGNLIDAVLVAMKRAEALEKK